MLLLGAEDVAASKRFYVDHGLSVAKSFGRKYVEFEASSPSRSGSTGAGPSPRTPASPQDGTGSHRLAIGSDAGPFTDPDGFEWEAATIAVDRVGEAIKSSVRTRG